MNLFVATCIGERNLISLTLGSVGEAKGETSGNLDEGLEAFRGEMGLLRGVPST